jgi:hypothetical protein
MFHGLFERPNGVGSRINIYMFSPKGICNALKSLMFDTPYFIARVKVIIYQLAHPKAPWLTSAAIRFLTSYLKKDMCGFEFGSGRSTKWLARRIDRLVSIEDDAVWYRRVQIDTRNLGVDYRFASTEAGCDEYVGHLASFGDETFDLIVVDGSCRNQCIAASATKVKKRGIVVVDNSDMPLDLRPLAGFRRHSTDNGVWRTDIYVRP